MTRRWVRRHQRGQASVELALVLPVVVLALLIVVQVGLVVRDRLSLIHATRVAGRAVIVEPTEAAARRALDLNGGATMSVQLSGDLRPGGLATVEVSRSTTRVPLIGPLVRPTMQESASVLVE